MNHPLAHVFGCEPDYNAWTEKENKKPRPPHEHMRSAGGHIHVETNKNPFHVAKMMDLHLGVPSVVMDEGEDRRKMYGGMGSCRVKPYGVEYRTLSNFWIFDEKLIRWAWKATERALHSKINVDEIQFYIEEAINKGDKDMANALISEYHLNVV
jgi:hypothetical protein